MGESTHIGWTDHTANFWMGCQRVSPGCERCYAEVLVTGRMKLPVWGPPKTTERHRAKGVWKDVPKWNAAAQKAGVRRRMFVSSLSDIFEDHPQVAPWRTEALALLEKCTSLDVQLLTKRPENIRDMVPPHWLREWPAHIWVGTTVEDQKRAEERIPELLMVPAAVRFLSCEPLLEAVRLDGILLDDGLVCPLEGRRWERLAPPFAGSRAVPHPSISWVIIGGESGSEARPFDIAWARSIISQCRNAGVPVFMKQTGARPVDSARAVVTQPCIVGGKPMLRDTIYAADAPELAQARIDEKDAGLRLARPHVSHPLRVCTKDRAGADPSEWPRDMRVQEFPGVSNVTR